jgi:signal transduction histidine kinase
MRLFFFILSLFSFLSAQEELSNQFFKEEYLIVIIIVVIISMIIRYFEYKQINKQLISSLNDIESITDSTVEGIIISEKAKCLDINASAMELLKVKNKEEILGLSPLHFIADESRSKVIENFKKDEIDLYEVNIKKMDGTTSPALVKGKNIKLFDKTVRVSLIVDMTEIKKKELRFLQQSKLAALGEMIGNIAHQWRQPLSVISTSATGMKLQKEFNNLSDEQFFQYCDNINENAQFLSQTIDDFRNFIQGDVRPVKFNLKNDTDSFIKLVDGTIKRYNIQVILELEENINIQGYPNELIQCFINIFNNSKDALVANTSEDKRYIFISEFNTEDQVMIIFKDNAGGIPNEVLPKIFDPYFTTKDKTQGTGLGLHITYNFIVNVMGGNIVVTNEEYIFDKKKYKGAQFKITIPIVKEKY